MLNEYQRGFNDGVEVSAIKVQNLLGIPFKKLVQIQKILRQLKLIKAAK